MAATGAVPVRIAIGDTTPELVGQIEFDMTEPVGGQIAGFLHALADAVQRAADNAEKEVTG